MQNDPKPAPDTSGAEATEREHPAARKMTASEYAAKNAGKPLGVVLGNIAQGKHEETAAPDPTPAAPADEPERCPDCGEVHESGPSEGLASLLASFVGRSTSTKVYSGHPVEIAADIIGQLRLSPRDLVTLSSALLCTVVERSHDDWGKQGNPFGHIPLEGMEDPSVNNPFRVGMACLAVVDSWGMTGFNPPPADPVAH